MLINSSSVNASLLLPHLSSSNSSLHQAEPVCFNFRISFYIFTAFSFTNILFLLPLCVLVLYLCLQQRQKQRSASTAATSSPSDIFTYHVVAMEMIGTFACAFYCIGACVSVQWLMTVGVSIFSITSNGQMLFHIFTCVDRHLAVVHPITYLSLRNGDGVRIRNVAIACVWLLCVASSGLILTSNFSTVPFFLLSVLSIAVVSFCSLSVLRTLIRPGPGEGGQDRERISQSKMRAFHTITAIMAALLLRFGGHVVILTIHSSLAVSDHVRCGLLVSGVWFCLPSSLVLPLLFLHRAGKLPCCKRNPSVRTKVRVAEQSG